MLAIDRLDADPSRQRARLMAHLHAHPAPSVARELLVPKAEPLSAPELQALADTLDRAARPLQRYRCAACGFEAQHHFWQCPGCMAWDSYPPLRLEEM